MKPSVVSCILAKAAREVGSSRVARVTAYAFTAKEPPAEIQLWNVGDNPTDYGIHKWTERSQVEVMARYDERGNPLLIDVEHNGATVEGEPAVTGGYARLELRDGAPWLVFDWSAYAINQIASRQRLFMSPEYSIDSDSNEITQLYRVSLVADPGTYRARILAAADAGHATKGRTGMDPTLAAIMGILNSVADPAAAVDAIKGFVANLPGAEAPADTVDSAATDTPPAKPDDKPAFAAADDEADKKPVAAAAAPVPPPPPPAPVAPPVPIAAAASAAESESVKAARAFALQSENALRDTILLRDGHRLAPSVRQWASSQPLNVVRGLCSAAPETTAPPTRAAATRGAGHGTGEVRKGLEGKELEELQRGMGTFKSSAPATPHMNDKGEFVLPTITPTEHRRMQAAAAAKDGV